MVYEKASKQAWRDLFWGCGGVCLLLSGETGILGDMKGGGGELYGEGGGVIEGERGMRYMGGLGKRRTEHDWDGMGDGIYMDGVVGCGVNGNAN